ncbi:MAG TPA: hypothetical protein VFI11_04305 [Anaerolineales bacterium]|nr:hypothetical protein [Anaerolineales bacterium]
MPVPRPGSERYLLETLLAFAASVFLTRTFLSLTGYPQLGGGGLHIAHVLWGGLLLFVAALAPLLWANRWAFEAAAILAGLGVGLFIDEVGKFITATNDYFFPAAAPIVYAFFLITVLVYQRAKRQRKRQVRASLYHVLDGFQEWLDRDLDRRERARLRSDLIWISSQSEFPDWAKLGGSLLEFLEREMTPLAPRNRLARWTLGLRRRLSRWLSEARLRPLLAGGMLGLGMFAFKNPAAILTQASFPMLAAWLERLTTGRHAEVAAVSTLMLARVGLEIACGAALILGGMLLWMRRARLAVVIGYGALLLMLTTVDLLVFYFEQFSTMLTAGVQFLVLLGLLYYRREFLERERETALTA